MEKITLIEPVDMSRAMYGDGIATVVASAIRTIGDRLILVGLTSNEDKHPVGRWSKTTVFGTTCDFFPVMSVRKLDKKYIKNLSYALSLIFYWRSITLKISQSVFTQNYLVMWWLSICRQFTFRAFYLPGLANPLLVGRKAILGKVLFRWYERIHMLCLSKMDLVLAAASKAEIDRFQKTWVKHLKSKTITQMPTTIDTNFFSPQADIERLKQRYSIADGIPHFVFVGRLARVKGVNFLVDALGQFHKKYGRACLLLVGDGEERDSLKRYAESAGLDQDVTFLGNRMPRDVRDIVNCADVCVVGSTFEGFSCAMVEQLACGKPIVTTNVSGADEIVNNGQNGFIVQGRDANEYADYMYKALSLPDAGKKSREIAVTKYAEKTVWGRFIELLDDANE